MDSSRSEAMAGTAFERNIESALREPIESVRDVPLADRQRAMEGKSGKPLAVVDYSPLIGRGSVLADKGVTHHQAEAAYERATRTPWHEYIRSFWLWWRR